MTELHWSQALLASHGASASIQMPSWIHWPQAPATFFVAVVIGLVSLLYGFHHKGRPFGSREATTLTSTIIAATALIAAVLSVFVPHLPLSIGIFIPALLCRSALKEKEDDQELRAAHPQLAAIVTLGITYLANKLRDRMADDRASWCEHQVDQLRVLRKSGVENELATLRNFATAAAKVRSKLTRRLPEDQKVQVEDHYSVIDPAVRAATDAWKQHNDEQFSKEYNNAEVALHLLLEYAYNWKYTNIDSTVTSKTARAGWKVTATH